MSLPSYVMGGRGALREMYERPFRCGAEWRFVHTTISPRKGAGNDSTMPSAIHFDPLVDGRGAGSVIRAVTVAVTSIGR